jgi:hypothetical protein
MRMRSGYCVAHDRPNYDPDKWWPCFVCNKPICSDPACNLCSDCRVEHVNYFKKLGIAAACDMQWPIDTWPLWFRWSIFFDARNTFRDKQGYIRGYRTFFSAARRPVTDRRDWTPLL